MWQKQVGAMCAQAFNVRKKKFYFYLYIKLSIILKGKSYPCHCEIHSQGIQILFFDTTSTYLSGNMLND